jgi:two-component system, NtrC family, response regulator AtoC
MKILIVDDDLEIQSMLEEFFKSMNHSVISAASATEGTKQLVLAEPDLVFLDIRLPDKDGIEVLKEMKQINKNLPVVMITGYKEAEKVIEAFRYGALDCLLKPFNFDYIRSLLPQIRIKNR